MTQLINNRRGGLDIDGLTFECISNGSFKAGDFVNFRNEIGIKTNEVLDTTIYDGNYPHVCQVNENHVFLVNAQKSTDTELYASLIRVENGTFTILDGKKITNSSYSGDNGCCTRIDDTRVLLTYGRTNSRTLHAMVCTISGNTFTMGTEVQLNSSSSTAEENRAIKLSDTRFLIVHRYGTRDSVYGTLIDVNGATITKVSEAELADDYSARNFSPVLVDENKVLVVHSRNGSTPALNAFIVTVEGDTIKAGTDSTIVDKNYAGTMISACKVGSKVLIAYLYDRATSSLGLITVKVNGTIIITTSGDKEYPATMAANAVLTPYSDNEALLIHPYDEEKKEACATVIHVEDVPILFERQKLSTDTNSAGGVFGIIMNNGTVFMTHRYNNDLHVAIANIEKSTYLLTDRNIMYGVALKKGTHGQQTKVAIPKL